MFSGKNISRMNLIYCCCATKVKLVSNPMTEIHFSFQKNSFPIKYNIIFSLLLKVRIQISKFYERLFSGGFLVLYVNGWLGS